MNTQPNMVKQDNAEVLTTQAPARSASLFICCAMAKPAIAHGGQKTVSMVMKSISLKPM